MKTKAIIVALAITSILFSGCTSNSGQAKTTQSEAKVDAVTSASLTTDPEVLAKGLGKDGKWLMGITADMTTDKELVLEGDDLTKPDKNDPSKKVPAGKRMLVLAARNDKKEITANYILTAKKLTVKSLNGKIEGGTFKGDIYIESTGFNLEAAKVDGNLYFANEEAQKTFKMDEKSSVTGKQELKK